MPELPEVETVARGLGRDLKRCFLKRVDVYDRRLELRRWSGHALVRDVYRVGKQVVIEVEERGRKGFFVFHLRMTGRLLWMGKAQKEHRKGVFYRELGPLKAKHVRAQIRTDRGDLLFVDPRRFGTLVYRRDFRGLVSRGVEPLSAELDDAEFGKLMCGSRQGIKSWLLRQDKLVGIGNIYASEILFEARLGPRRRAGNLSFAERAKLLRAIRKVLTAAIAHNGTTFSDFQKVDGERGSHQKYLRVYDREGLPCRRCRGVVVRIVQQGRSTFFCPSCQSSVKRGRKK